MNCETWQLFKNVLRIKMEMFEKRVARAGGIREVMRLMRLFNERQKNIESGTVIIPSTMEIEGVDEEQALLVRDYIQLEYLSKAFDKAHVFEVDEVQMRLIQLTDSPKARKIVEDLRLPFPTTYLDMRLPMPDIFKQTPDEVGEICGVCMLEVNIDDTAAGYEVVRYEPRGLAGPETGRMAFIAWLWRYDGKDGRPEWGIADMVIPLNEVASGEFNFTKQKVVRQRNWWQSFVTNFLLFVNHPDVELIEHVRGNPKSEARRLKQGKMILPSSTKVVLTGKLKRYVDAMGESLAGPGFDHKFWVRGHWRHHRAARYKDAKGKVLWIEPFIKGTGPFKDTTYALKKEEGTA